MGKQGRLRKKRKAQGVQRKTQGMAGWKASSDLTTEDIEALARDTYPELNQILAMSGNEQFTAILHWVNENQENVMVEQCAAFILMNTPFLEEYPSPIDDDGELKHLRNVLLLASGLGLPVSWGNAAQRILKRIPFSKDDSDLLYPLKNIPAVSDPVEKAAIVFIQSLLQFRASAYLVLGFIHGKAFGNSPVDMDVARKIFTPLRFLFESEQGDKLWKALDEMELSSDSETQTRTAHFFKWLPYDLYLRSPHWKRVRNAALERAHHRCQVCNATGRLEVHHRTYDRRGQELLEDVTVLCRNCHETFHRNGRLTKGDVSALGVGTGDHGL